MLKQTEHELQKVLIEYLERKGYYTMRLNSGMMRGEYKGKTWVTKLAKKGTPDLMTFKKFQYIVDGRRLVDLIFIEVKLPGKKPTPTQADMMLELENYGATCLCIHSLDELMELI